MAAPLQAVTWHRSNRMLEKCRNYQSVNRKSQVVNQHKQKRDVPTDFSKFDDDDFDYFE